MRPDEERAEGPIEYNVDTPFASNGSFAMEQIGYIAPNEEDVNENMDVDHNENDSSSDEDMEDEEEDENEDEEGDEEGHSRPLEEHPPEEGQIIGILSESNGHSIDPATMTYINSIEHKIILLGNIESIPKAVHGNIKDKGLLTEKQRKLFRFVNIALQCPASLAYVQTRWASPRTIAAYKYIIRDYVSFVAENKLDNEVVDENNFHVNGLHAVQCMKDIVEQRKIAQGGEFSGYIRKLESWASALEGLQACIALFRSSHIERETERETMFVSLKDVRFAPRIKDFVQQRKQISKKAFRDRFDDKAKNLLSHDRYSNDDVKQMVTNMLNRTSSEKKAEIYEGINSTMELLLGHHCLFRGENKRMVEISDTYYIKQDTSRGNIPVLVFQLNREKTLGPDGKPRCMGTCRSKDVRTCLVSAYALSLWFRFDFEIGPCFGEKAPDFLNKKSWYIRKVLFSDRSNKSKNAVSYQYENKLMTSCLNSIGLLFRKTTHLSRKSSAQNADANGISIDDIEKAGHWSNSALVKYYLSPFPFNFMHYITGFKSNEDYRIPRDIDPPNQLKKLIFPNLEKWIAEVNARPNQEDLPPKERDGAVLPFLKMLDAFRPIILQDLAMLMEICPSSIYCRHEITSNPLFISFQARVKEAMLNETVFPDLSNLMQQVRHFSSPIHSALRSVAQGVENGFRNLSSEFKSVKSTIDYLRDELHEREQRFMRQEARLEDTESRYRVMEEKLVRIVEELGILKEMTTGIHSSLHGSAPMNLASEPEAQAGGERISDLDVPSSVATAPPLFETDPRFALYDNTTIPALLDEWYISTPVRFSVAHRNKVYKADWRKKKSKVHPMYRRKKATINFIEKLSKKLEDGRLSWRQLGFLSEKYRESLGLTLPNLIRFKLEQSAGCESAIASVVDMWEGFSPEERQEVYDITGEISGVNGGDVIESTE